jgi:hypothetical protein
MPWQTKSIPFTEQCVSDSYTICVPLAHMGTTERTELTGKPKTTFQVEEVKVVASNHWKAGSVVQVLIPWPSPVEPLAQLPLGKQILLIGSIPNNGKLFRPIADQCTEGLKIWLRVDGHFEYPANGEEMLGLVWFPTRATALPSEREPDWQFISSLATALRTSSTAEVEVIADYIWFILPPGANAYELGAGHTFDRFANLLSGAIAKHKPYDQALIYFALNKHSYFGTWDLYYRAVRASATDEKAFPNRVPEPRYWENIGVNPQVPKGFKHDEYPPTETARILASSRNPRISKFLLKNFWPEPGRTEQKLLRPVLDDRDAEVRYLLTLLLARWNSDPDHTPKPKRVIAAKNGNEQFEYPELDDVVAYWKQKLS